MTDTRLAKLRLEYPVERGVNVIEWDVGAVDLRVEVERGITYDSQPTVTITFPEEHRHMQALTRPERTDEDTWPFEVTETDEPAAPSHRKPYNEKADRQKFASWELTTGRHAKTPTLNKRSTSGESR